MTTQSFTFSIERLNTYGELAKIRLVSLVLFSTTVGFFLAAVEPISWGLFFACLFGTALVSAGSMVLNQWMEQKQDALMARTASRPIPAGKVSSKEAFVFGVVISLIGVLVLWVTVNPIACFLAAFTLVTYLGIYTPLKMRTSLCTIVGAIPGAVPPLIGWAAATGEVPFEAWIIFAIMFIWQMPHFLAIAWLYRKDYAAGGFHMLSVTDPSGKSVSRQIMLYSFALLPVSLMPSVIGMTGTFYFWGALALGVYFISLGVLSLRHFDERARPLFRASILYLSLILVLMLVDKV